MINELFLEFAAVMITAGLVSMVAYKLRQPMIIAYIVTGILAGPSILGFTQSADVFQALSSIGLAFLLFIVGLNLNWRNIRDVGGVAMVGAVAQVIVTAAAGTGLAWLLRFDLVTSIFLGVSFAFSSTIVIVKLLSDKEDIERLYGRIAVGILLVQDLIAMVLLLLLSAYADGGSITLALSVSLIKGLAVVIVLWLIAKFIIPHLFRYAASSQELLFLVALSWCFAVASALQLLGFGIEIGALMAGITLAGSGFQHEIETKIKPLRDFFLVLFFIVLGTHLAAGDVTSLLVPVLVFTLFVVVGNPLLFVLIMKVLGYHPRTSFLTGTTLAQVSEFSFILISAGVAMGLLEDRILSLTILVALLTIAFSSYLIGYNEYVYEKLSAYLPFLRVTPEDEHSTNDAAPTVILLGYDRMGRQILPIIQELTDRVTVVDYDPAAIEDLQQQGVHAVYGDAGSEDLLRLVQADRAKMVISAIPVMSVNEDIVDFMHHRQAKGSIILTVKSSSDAARCYALGATFVIVPSILGGAHFAQLLKKKKTVKSAWSILAQKDKLHH